MARAEDGEMTIMMSDVPSAVSHTEWGAMVVGRSNGRRSVVQVVKCMGR